MSNGRLTKSLLIITGAMGAGKSAVLAEASDILAQRNIVHAAIDVDALGLAHLPCASDSNATMYDNLRSICGNYVRLGVQQFILARALEDAAQLHKCRTLCPSADTVVCRITASIEAMVERVRMRETGIMQEKYIARVAQLNAIVDRVHLEDFTVVNQNRSITEVALEMPPRRAGSQVDALP